MKVTIFDGYIDEPSRLGVPPYISPYPRYVAGAVIAAGHEPEYLGIDHWRQGKRPSGDVLFIISGALVPGKYLRTMPMSANELSAVIGGLGIETHVWYSSEPPQAVDGAAHVWGCDPDAYIHDLLTDGTPKKRRRTPEEWASWPVLGVPIIREHIDYPQPLIAELDMSYGCPHYISGGCSFCTEPLFGEPVFRDEKDVIAEIKALLKAGCTNFRLGGQSCIFSYKALGVGETDRPKPNVKAISTFFKGVSQLPGIKVLHTDNADPGIIASHPEEAEKILEIIVKTCTSGNLLSLGMESADPLVVERNNLNSTADEVLAAIRAINRAGSEIGPTGLPKLLPGLNILAGLEGETAETFAINTDFLKNVLNSDLLLRRINIRQVAPTRKLFIKPGNKKSFIRFKEWVRDEIDPVMLDRVAPTGTVLADVFAEVKIGKIMFGRQIGTYPILVGIPQKIEPGIFLDVKVTSHGSRSLTAVEYPLDINHCELSAMEALPGIGRKRAIRIFNARPLKGTGDLENALDEATLANAIIDFVRF
ncbi:MAG: radical SAM protein [Candidatus Thermoplasmatota archaeon]|nr:radical SAM protein [Euryarchaeota archaeon]MBU4032212.1 radical SAM protein [Candidatus Thermoplasmatota archaeon]MBU4071806.1 radical SAM protein [Candidatus Thermoplasmatota archaeon]MBU4143957.1 radical SAM protein [Candidatus Thermoplasmatota archaeon]MBU4592564.1 radical SAM protein [Candidatus Thermoplasmatota archaeon]